MELLYRHNKIFFLCNRNISEGRNSVTRWLLNRYQCEVIKRDVFTNMFSDHFYIEITTRALSSIHSFKALSKLSRIVVHTILDEIDKSIILKGNLLLINRCFGKWWVE